MNLNHCWVMKKIVGRTTAHCLTAIEIPNTNTKQNYQTACQVSEGAYCQLVIDRVSLTEHTNYHTDCQDGSIVIHMI